MSMHGAPHKLIAGRASIGIQKAKLALACFVLFQMVGPGTRIIARGVTVKHVAGFSCMKAFLMPQYCATAHKNSTNVAYNLP